MPKARTIFIFSLSRSGSTWLGKIFDSHPDILYLHEPDIADRGLDLLPFWFEAEPDAAALRAARRYLDRLVGARSPRATGTRPFFSKRYRGMPSEQIRRVLIYLAKGAERARFLRSSHPVQIPDFARSGFSVRPVIKSVTAHGRANALLKAAGGTLQPILLLRDPRSYVSSMIRGARMGVMEPPTGLGGLLRTQSARRLVPTPGSVDQSDEVAIHAWTWLLSNAEANAAIRAAGGTVVKYEALAFDPVGEAQRLFKRVNLEWRPETEHFLRLSAQREGDYYSVYRDPEKSANRWRTELGGDVIARIGAIVTRDPLGQSFFAR